MSGSYKTVAQEMTVVDALSYAFGELQSLRDEMRETADNMEGANMGHLPKCEQATECADTLDQVADDEPEVPEGLGDLKLTFHELVNKRKGRGPSRSVRHGNAVGALQAVADLVQELQDAEEYAGDEHEALRESAEEFGGTVQDAIDNVEGVDFPGMYG